MSKTIIISLGGSLIVPEEIDVDFLRGFRELILAEIDKGKKFIIITGGGKIARNYLEAAEVVRSFTKDELDWIGIYSTRFNAHFVRLLFGDEYTQTEIITDPLLALNLQKPITLGGGYKPGNSTDHVAVLIAKNIGAKTIINLSNTDYVYDSDPKTNPNAQKIEQISWAEYRELIPKEWNPGLNTPFDPIASELAGKEGIKVVIMNGKPIDNLAKYLNDEKFFGTIIAN